jgi:hypothetical protein
VGETPLALRASGVQSDAVRVTPFPNIRRRLGPLLLAGSLLLLPGCGGCRRGTLSSAHPVSLRDGTVVLVRDGSGYGAFVLRNQWPASGETVDYEWFFRTSRSGSFNTNDAGVTHGVVTNATRITFASFNVSWSGSTKGFGWLYYPRDQHGSGPRRTWELCVTIETNPAAIWPDDPKWRYRSRPPLSLEAEKRWFKSIVE